MENSGTDHHGQWEVNKEETVSMTYNENRRENRGEDSGCVNGSV